MKDLLSPSLQRPWRLLAFVAVLCFLLGAFVAQRFLDPLNGYEVMDPREGQPSLVFDRGKYRVKCAAISDKELQHLGVYSFQICANEYK